MTNKAKKLFDFIQSYIQKNGIAPSFDEMKNFMGLKSKSSIINMNEQGTRECFIGKFRTIF